MTLESFHARATAYRAMISLRPQLKGVSMTKHLLIFGGSGFIGQGICQEALKQNIPVVSISRSGQPQNQRLNNQPLITWVKADIFTDTHWHQYLPNAFGVINLIGILRENKKKQLTYETMIFGANQLIADQVKEYPTLPYLFLSANAGSPVIPKGYIENKRRAEAYLIKMDNPVIIFRPGLVVGISRPFSLIEGSAVFLLAQIPLIKQYFRPVYPITVEKLAKRIIAESLTPRSICLTPDTL